MTETFNWPVTSEAAGTGNFVVKRAKFGDGYSQEIPDGLNSEYQNWNVTVIGYPDEIAAPLAFIRARSGVSFFWTPPRGVQGYYSCKTYDLRDNGGGLWSLNMAFEQVFRP